MVHQRCGYSTLLGTQATLPPRPPVNDGKVVAIPLFSFFFFQSERENKQGEREGEREPESPPTSSRCGT